MSDSGILQLERELTDLSVQDQSDPGSEQLEECWREFQPPAKEIQDETLSRLQHCAVLNYANDQNVPVEDLPHDVVFRIHEQVQAGRYIFPGLKTICRKYPVGPTVEECENYDVGEEDYRHRPPAYRPNSVCQ